MANKTAMNIVMDEISKRVYFYAGIAALTEQDKIYRDAYLKAMEECLTILRMAIEEEKKQIIEA
jgi:hypothetical protein